MNKFSIFLCLLLSFASCEIIEVNDVARWNRQIKGLKPVYHIGSDWQKIDCQGPRKIERLGKIYYKDKYIFVTEKGKGIHIIDNVDKKNPKPIKFIAVIANEDMSIKNNSLYIDNYTDLVVLDISDIGHIKVVKRLKNVYDEGRNDFPQGYNGFFECADRSKGIVIDWEEKMLDNPTCRR